MSLFPKKVEYPFNAKPETTTKPEVKSGYRQDVSLNSHNRISH